jgi:ankyrin repeat protein
VRTSHMSLCIILHGSSFTQELFNCDLLSKGLVFDPLLLCALVVHDNDEDMVKKMVSRLDQLLGNNIFVQHYGIKALMLSVRKGNIKFVQMFLDLGVDPFASEPGFHNEDLWRQDRFEAVLRFHDLIPFNDLSASSEDWLPVEWLLHPICSTAFQTAYIADNMEVIDLFAAWIPKITTLTSDWNRKHQLSAAYIFDMCVGRNPREQRLPECEMTLEVARSILDPSMVELYLHVGLQYAITTRPQQAHLLLDMGACPDLDININYRYSDDLGYMEPPLLRAVRKENIGLIKRLLDLGADADRRHSTHRSSNATAAQIAAINGNFEILDLLVRAGADLNAPPGAYHGRTALEGAAEWGRLDMTSYLLSQGADVKGRNNKNYRRTMYRAWKNGHRVLARMIQEWKAEQYGVDDCDTIEKILDTVTNDELGW